MQSLSTRAGSSGAETPLVAGRYRLVGIVGEGGMGTVHRAVRVADGAVVALKTLRPGIGGDDAAASRLRREARILGSLRSPHAVRIHDAGQLPSGEPFFVMDLLEGVDLGTLVRTQGPLPPDVVAQVLRDACHALEEAHAHGVVHRDLKPQNLFFARSVDGTVVLKVLDFGLGTRPAQGAAPLTAQVTRSHDVLGTPAYMAPEQVRDATVADPRTDVYGLGVTAFSLLTGRLPFEGNNAAVILSEVLTGQALSLAETAPQPLPADLVAIVERCMAKEPVARFSDCAALRAALRELTRPSVAPPRPAKRAGTRAVALVALALGGVLVGGGARWGQHVLASHHQPR